MKKQGLSFLRLLQYVMFLFLAVIWLICITGTAHNIVWYKELFVTAVCLAGIFVFYLLLKRMDNFIQRHEKKLLWIFLAVFSVALYAVSAVSRNTPMYDYADIYQAAYALAYGGEVDWHYFALWSNNFPIFLLLAGVMKVCALLRLSDPFYVLLGINVALTVWGGRCVYRLVRHHTGQAFWAFGGLLLYSAFLPLWSGTNYFYTDSLSLAFGVWAWWKLLQPGGKFRNSVFAGFLWGIGFSMKATVAISLVAVVVVSVLLRERALLYRAAIAFVALLLCIGAWIGIRSRFPNYELEQQYKMPLTYWLAMGVHGNGSYPENSEFAVECMNTFGLQGKKELAAAYLFEHLPEAWSAGHFVSKARYNFASGKMGASEFNQYPGTLMYECMNDYGAYGGYSAMLASGYFYALLLMGMCGQLLSGRRNSEHRKDCTLEIAQFTVFGLFLFLMLWESNNRQLYNHIPWYTLYAVCGAYALTQKLTGGRNAGEKSVGEKA